MTTPHGGHAPAATPITVYVPAERAEMLGIDDGSGVVGTPQPEGGVLIDYEGNRHAAVNLSTWADRVAVSRDRHAARYPTIARSLVPADTLTRVGEYDPRTGDVHIDPDAIDRVAAWLGVNAADLDAQSRTTIARHQMRREVARMRANPATRAVADEYARRHRLDD